MYVYIYKIYICIYIYIRVCACVYIYIYVYMCVCVYTCLYVLLSFLKFACLLLAQILYMKILELTPQQTCIVICKKMPRPTVSIGPHPQPQQFLRIRYRLSDWMGHWFNVDNGYEFEPQFVGAMQFAWVILLDLDGHLWAFYANDIDDPYLSGHVWIWFPQGLNAHFILTAGIPARIPLPA